jgi:O-antigen/teichoic acid export membrane protein
MPIIAGVTVLPNRIVGLIYKPEYEAAGPILQVLIWVLLLEFLNPFLSHILFSQGKQRLSLVAAAVGLLTNGLLMFALVPWLGPVGAAWACVGSGAMATASYLYFTRELGLIGGLLSQMVRVALAAFGLGVVLVSVAQQSWPVVFLVAAATYAILLFVVQAVRWDDIRFIRQQFFQRAYAS